MHPCTGTRESIATNVTSQRAQNPIRDAPGCASRSPRIGSDPRKRRKLLSSTDLRPVRDNNFPYFSKRARCGAMHLGGEPPAQTSEHRTARGRRCASALSPPRDRRACAGHNKPAPGKTRQPAARNPVSAAAIAATTCDRPRAQSEGRSHRWSPSPASFKDARTRPQPGRRGVGGLMEVDW